MDSKTSGMGRKLKNKFMCKMPVRKYTENAGLSHG